MNTIPGIEEVLLVNDEEGTVLAFANPKVQASIAANTYVVSGPSQQKPISEAMTPTSFSGAQLQQLMAQMQSMGGLPAGLGVGGEGEGGEDEDDDVPELVGNFEQAAEEE